MDEINEAAIVQFMAENFNKSTIVIKELSSFEDTNVLVQSSIHNEGAGSQQIKLVLKIFSNTKEGPVDFAKKIECVNYLNAQNFTCSHFLPGVDGSFVQLFPESGPFKNRSACLYHFIEGKELEHTGYVGIPVIVSELGSFLAHFHRSLRNMPQALKESLIPDSVDPWSPHNYRLLCEDSCLQGILDSPKREILSTVTQYVLKTLSPLEHLLTKDILHGDFHGLNIIVNESYDPAERSRQTFFTTFDQNKHTSTHRTKLSYSGDDDDVQIEALKILADSIRSRQKTFNKDLLNMYGIIDFEQIEYCYTVLEVGRLIADVMVTFVVENLCADTFKGESKDSGSLLKKGVTSANHEVLADINSGLSKNSKDHLVDIGGYVMAGYLVVNELSPSDLKCIHPAMLITLCQYYILGARASQDPSLDDDYVSYCSRESLMLLEFCHRFDPDHIVRHWVNVAKDLLQTCCGK